MSTPPVPNSTTGPISASREAPTTSSRSALTCCAIRMPSSFGLPLSFFTRAVMVVEGLLDLGCAVEIEHHAADIGFVQDIGADHLGDNGKADLLGDLDRFCRGLRDRFLRDRNAVSLEQFFRGDFVERRALGLPSSASPASRVRKRLKSRRHRARPCAAIAYSISDLIAPTARSMPCSTAICGSDLRNALVKSVKPIDIALI